MNLLGYPPPRHHSNRASVASIISDVTDSRQLFRYTDIFILIHTFIYPFILLFIYSFILLFIYSFLI